MPPVFQQSLHFTMHSSSSTSTSIISQPICFTSHQRITNSFSLQRHQKNFPGIGMINAVIIPLQISISTSATNPSRLQFLILITSQFFISHRRIGFTGLFYHYMILLLFLFPFLVIGLCQIAFHKL